MSYSRRSLEYDGEIWAGVSLTCCCCTNFSCRHRQTAPSDPEIQFLLYQLQSAIAFRTASRCILSRHHLQIIGSSPEVNTRIATSPEKEATRLFLMLLGSGELCTRSACCCPQGCILSRLQLGSRFLTQLEIPHGAAQFNME